MPIVHFKSESCVVLERVLDASFSPKSSSVGLSPDVRASVCSSCGVECREVRDEEAPVDEGWEDCGDGESKVTP